jgi:hypothetical protein
MKCTWLDEGCDIWDDKCEESPCESAEGATNDNWDGTEEG